MKLEMMIKMFNFVKEFVIEFGYGLGIAAFMIHIMWIGYTSSEFSSAWCH